MKTKLNNEYFGQNNEEFYNEYFELLLNRLTHSSMSLETDLGDPDNSDNAIRLRDSIRAFKYLMNFLFSNQKISEDMIINTANIINRNAIYISKGYRKIGNYIAETDIPISLPENIQRDIANLLLKYQTEWSDLEPFEREAMFHIEFIRIHPFEDGNGRTGRLLLNYNLLNQGHAPVIITTDLREYYNSYIKDNDVDGMSNLFRIQSIRENIVLEKLYDEYKKEGEYSSKKF